MKKLILYFLLVAALIAPAMAQQLMQEHLTSWESGWLGYGTTGYSWTGKFLSKDTITTVTWFGSFKLNPEENDVTYIIRSDTSLGAATDTMAITAKFFPIVGNQTSARVVTTSPYYGTVMYDMGIIPTRCYTGTALTAFTVNPDTAYAFHSTTWWNGMEVLGVLGRWWTTATDSLYFDVIAQYQGNR